MFVFFSGEERGLFYFIIGLPHPTKWFVHDFRHLDKVSAIPLRRLGLVAHRNVLRVKQLLLVLSVLFCILLASQLLLLVFVGVFVFSCRTNCKFGSHFVGVKTFVILILHLFTRCSREFCQRPCSRSTVVFRWRSPRWRRLRTPNHWC